jgi:pyruvate/2-oxoglutarate dehydrogenase complex dihydrolipoamide acyltransferase (E2) component
LIEVRIPDGLWDTSVVAEGVVSTWFFDEGAEVEAGSVVAVIMVEKSEYDIEAPASGKLHITTQPDAPVTPGSVIAEIT